MKPTDDDFRLMIQHAHTGVLLHEVNSLRILWANKRACELFKYSVEELRSLKAHHMSSQDERYRREDGVAWLHSAAIYGSSQRQWKYLNSHGVEFLTSAVATLVPFQDRNVIMVEFQPIDPPDSEEDSVDWATTSLERIFSHTASGILVLDKQGRVKRASPYAAGLFGLTSENIVGTDLQDLGCVITEISEEEYKKALSEPENKLNFRMKIHTKGNTLRWIAAFLENIKIDHTSICVLTIRDITDRIEAEQRVNAQQTQLQYLSRYNAMGDMAMILAHDLGQPLAASLNFLSGLKARINSPNADPATFGYGIEMIEKQLNRASDIVSSAKRYVRKIESTTATFDLLDAVEDSLYFVRLRAEEFGVTVDVDLGTRPITLEGESVLIGQIIINLCMNAIDEIRRPETIEKTLKITLREYGGIASLSISDQGRGMQTIPADRLASGAFSSKEDGSGIGLIISEHIAQRHGGTIQFSPNEPRGTIATLSLPLKKSS